MAGSEARIDRAEAQLRRRKWQKTSEKPDLPSDVSLPETSERLADRLPRSSANLSGRYQDENRQSSGLIRLFATRCTLIMAQKAVSLKQHTHTHTHTHARTYTSGSGPYTKAYTSTYTAHTLHVRITAARAIGGQWKTCRSLGHPF